MRLEILRIPLSKTDQPAVFCLYCFFSGKRVKDGSTVLTSAARFDPGRMEWEVLHPR